MFEKIFKSKIGIIMISILWGLGLASMFRYSCGKSKCTIVKYRGPNIDEIKNTIFNYGTNECYKFYPTIVDC